ncbi:MAG TPA: vitamin B12 dependent methionine synthase [Clostridia bacterium]|nr:vitamin B12 dependent methionine synthase [Clostridia bacterium]
MSLIILDSIDFKIDINLLLKSLHMDEDSEYIDDILSLGDKANEIGRPKAIYKEACLNAKGAGYAVVDGIKLSSNILSVNIGSVDRIFPYICTCGKELNDWAKSLDDILEQYWADRIMELALQQAIVAFQNHLKDGYRLGTTSNMNPGSLQDWPISQQKQLFAIMGNPYEKIGVELTDSFLMWPIKSLSGIRYESDVEFINCQLCPRERCENRRVEYDSHLYH